MKKNVALFCRETHSPVTFDFHKIFTNNFIQTVTLSYTIIYPNSKKCHFNDFCLLTLIVCYHVREMDFFISVYLQCTQHYFCKHRTIKTLRETICIYYEIAIVYYSWLVASCFDAD